MSATLFFFGLLVLAVALVVGPEAVALIHTLHSVNAALTQ